MLKAVPAPNDNASRTTGDNQWTSFRDEYFSLGAWPQLGLVPEVVTTPEFIEGNTP
jgi:hypothetical protein